jgi:hypothetical protein
MAKIGRGKRTLKLQTDMKVPAVGKGVGKKSKKRY